MRGQSQGNKGEKPQTTAGHFSQTADQFVGGDACMQDNSSRN
jgi:hypothetical protein